MRSATVALRYNELFCVDDTAVLHNIASDCGVILDRLRRNCFQTSNLRVNGGLVASQATEDLLTSNGVGLIHGVVGAVSSTIVAIKTESTASAEIALNDCTCDQVLIDDSRGTEKSTN